MPKDTIRESSSSPLGGEADPLLLDSEQIQSLAQPTVIHSALRHCNEHRVTDVERVQTGIYARVEDAHSEEQLEVEITCDTDGTLLAGCDCGGSNDGTLCVHAIAALFAYAKGQNEEASSDPSRIARCPAYGARGTIGQGASGSAGETLVGVCGCGWIRPLERALAALGNALLQRLSGTYSLPDRARESLHLSRLCHQRTRHLQACGGRSVPSAQAQGL